MNNHLKYTVILPAISTSPELTEAFKRIYLKIEILQWLDQNVAMGDSDYDSATQTFYFHDEVTAILFKLKWA